MLPVLCELSQHVKPCTVHPALNTSTSILFHLLIPCGQLLCLSYSCIPGHKNAALTEHLTLQMYICYFVELGELVGLNFLIPYCEKNTLVHFFPLEKHRHNKMQLSLRPISYCNPRSCKRWEIFIFLPFYSDTWVAVHLSFLH